MAVQHTEDRVLGENEHKIKKKMKTKDKEMALGRRHGQVQDPRPACGDYRLVPECVHTIMCRPGAKTSTQYPDYVVPTKFV